MNSNPYESPRCPGDRCHHVRGSRPIHSILIPFGVTSFVVCLVVTLVSHDLLGVFMTSIAGIALSELIWEDYEYKRRKEEEWLAQHPGDSFWE